LKTYKNAKLYTNSKRSVVTIGTFDGVHIGHRKIIERLLRIAKNDELSPVLLTFFPHPRMVLQKDSGLKLIHTIEERKQILETTGLPHLVIHPFDKEFANLSAEDYVRDLLCKQLDGQKIVIGYDHHFGKARSANIIDLKAYSKQLDFEVEEISKQEIESIAVSSTKIRKALLAGEIKKANNYLGYPFILTGTVIHGKQLGRTIGFPTANLHIKEDYKLIPKSGVYLSKAIINGETYFGMTNIGSRPTIEDQDTISVETYFFELEKDLYDTKLQIQLLDRIRDEQKFESITALQQAIEKDKETAIKLLNYRK